MHSLTFTLNGKKHVITGDRDSLDHLVDALRKARDIPAKITDLSASTESFQHIYGEGSKVWFKNQPYVVIAVVPGLDLLSVAHMNTPYPAHSTMVKSSDLIRRKI